MKNLKKALSLLLTLAIACSLCVTVFATENEGQSSVSSVATDIPNQSEYNDLNKAQLGEHTTDVYLSKGSTYTVTIPKTIILSGETGIGNYSVEVTGDIEGEKQITVIPYKDEDTPIDELNKLELTQSGKDNITATIVQSKTVWIYKDLIVDEENTNNNIATGTITVDKDLLTAGSWSGSFLMHIAYAKETITFTVVNNDERFVYQAEKDMTWEQFINSKYNDGTFAFDEESYDNIVRHNGCNLEISTDVEIDDCQQYVNTIIVDGATYFYGK